ncbi:ABC transporter permease [Viridibacillus sp. YIM B01967]|uniref:ABC transporter permease n=1 Tax=Viridibacillus soli TaxID=2798301 RepID=A0ABS1HAW7_9BACL|nr:ABC transporter permease [Viridibacillus soli]MBK3496591.1 ABC transporter permease [Viridibacillus soli]
MTLSQLVLRSLKKNITHYYLYFFALIFSVTLYFSFVTLQFNPSVSDMTEGSTTGAAGFKAASAMLLFIVTFFVIYANHLFMKRRSKEIGLYQLIGMSKTTVVRLLSLENILLWVGATTIGVGIGFLTSRVFAMILLKLISKEALVEISFSSQAFVQTMVVFLALLVLITVQTIFVIRRSTLLDLFLASKKGDTRVKRIGPFQMLLGLVGVILISFGYYKSTHLFDLDSDSVTLNLLIIKMITILASTIIGTFFVFRFSVSFIMNVIRKGKKGHLSLNDVLALTPIMHRMKGNAKSLTLITIMTAIALAIMSLSYISYYSAGSSAKQFVPFDIISLNGQNKMFEEHLKKQNINYEKYEFSLLKVDIDTSGLLEKPLADSIKENMVLGSIVTRLSDMQKIHPKVTLKEGEAYLVGNSGMLAELLPLEVGKSMTVHTKEDKTKLTMVGLEKEWIISSQLTYGSPAVIVTDKFFDKLVTDTKIKKNSIWYKQEGYSFEENDLKKAQEIYEKTTNGGTFTTKDAKGKERKFFASTQEGKKNDSLELWGNVIFATGFLGLAFLLATGSILYFKQMSDAEDERESYTVLRKIGFTKSEIMKGIYIKQAFNFGVPLLIGLLHSYFAVKSGWMLFGSELTTPLIVTMSIYALLYSVFAWLSVMYYRKVVNESL